MIISSSSLAPSISLGPSAGRSTQATSRGSQPARSPRTAGRRRSARAMFRMRPRAGGGGGPAPQAPPPTAPPRRRVARSVILRAAARPSRRATPLPAPTAAAEPVGARLGSVDPAMSHLLGPSGLHRRALFAPGLSAAGLLTDGRVLQRQWLRPTMYHAFMKTSSGSSKQDSQASATRSNFLTNHAHVLVCVAHDSGIRLRDIAAAVGITERAAHRILSELVEEGYVLREREGRRNRYQVKPRASPAASPFPGAEVGDLLKVLSES